jgi:hypothetical protein
LFELMKAIIQQLIRRLDQMETRGHNIIRRIAMPVAAHRAPNPFPMARRAHHHLGTRDAIEHPVRDGDYGAYRPFHLHELPACSLLYAPNKPPTLDDMLDAAWDVAKIYFPFSDVMVSRPCAVLDRNITSALYIGQSVMVGDDDRHGRHCERWPAAELWIGAKDHLPRSAVDAVVLESDKTANAARIAFQPPLSMFG